MLEVSILATPAHDGVVSHDRFERELLAALSGCADVAATRVGRGRAPASVDASSRARARRSASRFISYPRMARRVQADVFHVTDPGYAHVAAVLPAQRVMATCHDLLPLRAGSVDASLQGSRITRVRYRFSVSFLRRLAHVACVSEATRADVIELVGVDPERTSVVPNGLDERFRPLGSEQRRLARAAFPAEARLLLHVGSGAPYKNVEGTLAVLSRLRSRGIDAVLVRAGAALTSDQRALAGRLGVERAVRDLGPVSDERLVGLYNAADVMLFPSFWEGFGWPALEALACGTATVVSDCAALRETVGDAALAAPAGDAEALTGAVLRLWDSPDLRRSLRDRGLARARQHSWRSAARRYAELYRAINERAGPRRPPGLPRPGGPRRRGSG